MEYPDTTFKQFETFIQGRDPLEQFQNGGVTVSWYEGSDFKLNDDTEQLSDGYIRVDTDPGGTITRVEDEFINLPNSEWEMDWY